MSIRTKVQLGLGFFIFAILGVFLFLNRELVSVNLIFATVSMSRAVVVLGFFISGFLLGWIANSLIKVRLPKSNDT